ncbi:uncharacterized protein LOC113852262 [Abrus precatorius]|uniref:Uncharacterized protein LOC113852262 n=1 Tax=Abrus precatorius TaxID=3816 RepID=A0A8B8K3J3_ABRPR|nr:uncharacterized protein LOC113852262 [Abrus precatorius]
MEGMKGNEVGDGMEMQCMNHPHRNNPQGICAFCLKDKLRNLLSSSLPFPTLSPSSSPSPSSIAPPPLLTTTSLSVSNHNHYCTPSLLPNKKNNKPSSSSSADTIFKRSKSIATPKNHFMGNEDFSPRKTNRFWSFLYLSYSAKPFSSSCRKKMKANPRISTGKPRVNSLGSSIGKKCDMAEEEYDSDGSSLERKVSRSRSVGCGSRSFSADFFERISSGLGDCTLRRVESQRQPNEPKVDLNHGMKERLRCGGIFGGFMITSSSPSFSSVDDGNGESTGMELSHWKSRNWGWAFSSPMRVLSSITSSKDNKKGTNVIRNAYDKIATPNLSAIPSLLTVKG